MAEPLPAQPWDAPTVDAPPYSAQWYSALKQSLGEAGCRQLGFYVIPDELLLSVVILFSRPYIYRGILKLMGEPKEFAREVGARMGQSSEFGLIIAVSAVSNGKLSAEADQLIRLTVIITMIISSYYVVSHFPTPIGAKPGLQRD